MKEERVITSKDNLINVLTNLSYDLISCLLEIVSNENFTQSTSIILESNLYWIGKLSYKDKDGKIKKLSNEEYKKYLFTIDLYKEPNLERKFKNNDSFIIKKYCLFVDVITHILSLENIIIDAPEYMMFIGSIPNQKEIVVPEYESKNSIYPCNMPNMRFEELLEFRNMR